MLHFFVWRKLKYFKCVLKLRKSNARCKGGSLMPQTDTEGNVLGLYLNLKLWDLLLKFSHCGNVVSFPQPHCHHLFFALQKSKPEPKEEAQDLISTTVLPKSERCWRLSMIVQKICIFSICRPVNFAEGNSWDMGSDDRNLAASPMRYYQNKSLPPSGCGYWLHQEVLYNKRVKV